MRNPGSRPASQGSLIVFRTSQFGVFLTAYGRACYRNFSPFLTLVTRGKHITASVTFVDSRVGGSQPFVY
mgnify:FL=1|jgi:hypothetical protein